MSDKQRIQGFEKADRTSFKARLRKTKRGFYDIAIPPFVVDKERLRGGERIKFVVEEIQRETHKK